MSAVATRELVPASQALDLLNRDWIAQPGSQQVYLSCPVFEVLYHGTRGPGKTDALLVDFAQEIGKGYGEYWRGVIFRQTYKQLKDVISKSKRLFKRRFPGAQYNGSDYSWVFPDGEELLLRQALRPDDYDNYHGHEYPFVGWEELTNWADDELYESMKSTCRASLAGMPRKYRATCNPFGVGHNWVKGRFITPAPSGTIITDEASGKQRVAIKGHIFENKILLQSDPEYMSTLLAIKSVPKRKAWLHGDWNITAGGMFDDVWDEDTHILRPFDVPPSWRIYRAYDHGSSKPFSLGWWARSDGTIGTDSRWPKSVNEVGISRPVVFPPGSLIRIKEWYGYTGERNVGLRMLPRDIGKQAKKLEMSEKWGQRVLAGPADSGIYDTSDGKNIAGEFAKEGIHFVPADKVSGSRKNGWELMRGMFGAAIAKNDEAPWMMTFNTCTHGFIPTVPGLPRDLKDMDDVDTKSEDHTGDEARYMALQEARILTQGDMYAKR